MEKGIKFTKWRSKFDSPLIIGLINQKLNGSQISAIVGIPKRRLYEMLQEEGIEIINKGQILPKNEDYFESIDSEVKAYILGYTIADGCVSIEPRIRNGKIYSYNKRLTFCSSIDDREVIELIRDEISPKLKLRITHNQSGALYRKPQYNLKISSAKIISDLMLLNMKPRKTYDINFKFDFSKINKSLHRHFIRGYMDGNGWVSQQLGFACTSIHFLKQIDEFFKQNIKDLTSNLTMEKGKTVSCYRLNINTNDSNLEDIYDLLYTDSNYFLTRKQDKFLLRMFR